MASFDAIYEAFLFRGLENFRKYYGLYRGVVMRNDDPDKRGRIQVKVLLVGHTDTLNVWVDPAFDGAGTNRGSFFPPEVGDSVRVGFEFGRSDRPVIYFGGWFGIDDLPTEFAYTENQELAGQTGGVPVPERRGFVTRKGHRLVVSDVDGQEMVELAWHKPAPTDPARTADQQGDRSKTADRTTGQSATLTFTPDGDVVVTNQNGSTITLSAKNRNVVVLDENQNMLTLDKTGVTVDASKTGSIFFKAGQINVGDGADSPGVRGRELNSWLVSHTHGTAWGPSTPPLSPPPPSILSKVVKIK